MRKQKKPMRRIEQLKSFFGRFDFWSRALLITSALMLTCTSFYPLMMPPLDNYQRFVTFLSSAFIPAGMSVLFLKREKLGAFQSFKDKFAGADDLYRPMRKMEEEGIVPEE